MTIASASPSIEISDPKLRALCNHMAKAICLAADRAVAHTADKAAFAIPNDPNSFEQIVTRRLKEIKPENLQAAQVKVLAALKNPLARRSRYAALGPIDLKSTVAVDKQVDARPLPTKMRLNANDLKSLRMVDNELTSASAGDGMRPQAVTDHLELRITAIRCVDETNPEAMGADEIALGGTSIDENGNTKKIDVMDFGDFANDGVLKEFNPPRRFTTFDLTEGTNFPKTYFVTMVLAELDNGGFPSFLHEMTALIKTWVKSKVEEAGGSIGGVSGAAISAVIGAAVSAILESVIQWLISIWEDDLFLPITVSATIQGFGHRWNGKTDSPNFLVWWKGHGGHYRLRYDWRMVTG